MGAAPGIAQVGPTTTPAPSGKDVTGNPTAVSTQTRTPSVRWAQRQAESWATWALIASTRPAASVSAGGQAMAKYRPRAMRSDHQDRLVGADTLDRVVEHDVAHLQPAVRAEGPGGHPEDPVGGVTRSV